VVVLGIDPGLRVTGYACARKAGAKTSIFDYGYQKLASTDSVPKRLKQLYDFFDEKIRTHAVTHISIETPFLGKNTQSFVKLGYVRALIYLLSEQHGLTLSEHAPTQVKAAVTGHGGASKEQVALMLERLFPTLATLGVTVKSDVTDAIAVALTGMWGV
jgi:crossover junction endodeoxyribonuclease RuvC